LDHNGNAGLDTSKGTGFAITGGSLGLALILANPDSLTGDNREYLALTAQVGAATMLGLPSDIVINASNISVGINRAYGTVPGSGTPGTATPALDWATDLDINQDGTTGDKVTFFQGTPQASEMDFAGEFTQVSGTLNLKAGGVLEANATFVLSSQTVNVSFGTTPGGIDLHKAQMLLLNMTLFNPKVGSEHGLVVGVPGGLGFGVDSGQLTYAQVAPNTDATLSPPGFNGTYSAVIANVSDATLSGLPPGITIEATQLNFSRNSYSGTSTGVPPALNWTTMIDPNPSDTTFKAGPVVVGGTTVTLTDPGLSVGGSLILDVKGFVLASGTFAFAQTLNQTISDGTALTTTPLTGVTVQTIAVSNVNLFVGANGAFAQDSKGNPVLDGNGNATIDTSKGTGFSVTGASLDLVTATETTGQQRSWMGLAAHIDKMGTQGLPNSLTLEVQSLDLIYNGPDKTTGSKLDWADVTITGSGGTATPLSTFFKTATNATLSSSFANLTETTDISASGMLYLNVSDFVIALATFSITEQSGIAVNDGTIVLSNASDLVIQLTNAQLFVGMGGAVTRDSNGIVQSLDLTNAVGFSASGANIGVAIIHEDPSVAKPRTWVGLAASIASMTAKGLPADFTLSVMNLNVQDNIAAADNSQMNWNALASQAGNVLGLANTPVASLTNNVAFEVAGEMMISILSYVYVSGAFTLERRKMNAQTSSSSSTSTSMSVLSFGANNLRAFIGTAPVGSVFNANGGINDDSTLQANNALGVSLTISNLALALMKPVAASTKSYFALKASGSAALIGVDNVTLAGQLNVSVNEGRDSSLATPSATPAIDFPDSAKADPTDYGSTTGLAVTTGASTTTLDFNTTTLDVSGMVSLGISQFVYATGNFDIQKDDSALATAGTVTLSNGSTVTGVSVLTIGASHVNVFVGTGGPYFNNTSTPSAAGATGVAFSDLSFALALMSSQTSANSFYALEASGSGALVGVTGVTMSAQGMTIQANGGRTGSSPSTPAAVNLIASFGSAGLSVPTGPSSATSLTYTGPIVSVSGSVTLNIGTNVFISGTMAFSEGGTVTATLSDGSTKELSLLTVGASSVSIFLGANGPATNANAEGVSLTGGTFGLALLTPTDSRDTSRYFGIDASATSIGLVGISGIQLTVTQLAVLVNGSTDATMPNRVVDFSKTDWNGSTTPGNLTIMTGPSTSVDLNEASQVIEASGNVGINLLNGLATLSGSVAIKISKQTVVLSDTTSVQVSAVEIGLANGTATITGSGSDSASISGVTLGMAYFTPDKSAPGYVAGDSRSWLGLETMGGTVTAGTGTITAGISNFAVSLNQGYGALNGVQNTTAVNFKTSFNGALLVATGGLTTLGTPLTVSLGFTDQLLSLSAQVTLYIGNFFYAQGAFSFSSLANRSVNVVDTMGHTTSTPVSIKTLGVTGASVFAGNDGPYQNPDGTVNPNAVGFQLTGVTFVVVEMTETGVTTPREWDAVMATASSAGLVGIDGFSLSVSSVTVDVNNPASDGSVVDFASTYETMPGKNDGSLPITTGGTPASLSIGYSGKIEDVAANATLSIGNFVYISGHVAFQTGNTVTATLSDKTTKPVSVLTVGASDVNIFVGVNGPPLNSDGSVNTAAAGLSITNATFGLALLKPTATTDTSSYYGLSATAASVGFVGLGNDIPDLKVDGLTIQVNGGTDAMNPGRVVDFNDTDWGTGTPGGLVVSTGGTPVDLNFTDKTTIVSVDKAVLSIGGFVQISGGFTFSQSPSVLATLADGTSKNVEVTTLAFTGVNAFVGEGPYFAADPSNNTTNPNAAGLLLSGANLSIALFKPTDQTDSSHYFAVSASANSISLPGLALGGSDAFTLSASGYRIEVNGGTDGTNPKANPAINFIATYGSGGLQVGDATFTFTSALQRVAIDQALLDIGDYVYVSGGLSFTRQQDLTVTLNDVAASTRTVNAYAFEAGNVNIFVGSGHFPIGSNTPDSSSVGLALENVNFGLVVMKPTDSAHQSVTYIALKATANFAGLVGIDNFQLSASGINVEYNTVKDSTNSSDTTVVDFSKLTGGGYSLDTGNGTLNFDYKSELLEASVDSAVLQIGSYVYVHGSFFFEKGASESVTLASSPPSTISVSSIDVGASGLSIFFGVGGPFIDSTTTPNAVGLAITNATLGMTLLTPTDPSNQVRYIALDATADQVGFVGTSAFQLGASNVDVQLNLATESGVDGSTLPVVNFDTSFPVSATNPTAGLKVATDTSGTNTINLDFTSRLIHASADDVLVSVGQFLYVHGSVAFDLGTQQKVTINTGIPASLVDALGPTIVNAAVTTVNNALNLLSGGLSSLQTNVQDALKNAITTLKNTINGLENSVVDTIANAIQNALSTALKDAKAAVTSLVTQALNSSTSSLSVDSLIDDLLMPIVNDVPAGPMRSMITSLLDPVKSLIRSKFESVIQQAISGAVDKVANSLSTAIDAGVQNASAQIKANIQAALQPVFDEVTTELQSIAGQITGELAPIFTQLQSLASVQFGSNFATITNVTVNVTTLGISNATAFVGMGYDSTKLPADQTSAMGLLVQNLNLGLALLKPVSDLLPTFTAAKITADSVSLNLGASTDITMFANNVDVELNLGGPIIQGAGVLLGNATVDFVASFGASGFKVPTDTSGTNFIDLDFSHELIKASVADATLQIFGFVYVTGSFAFEQGSVHTVNVTGGLATSAASAFLSSLNLPSGLSIPATGATSTQLSFMTVGASNVHAFVGVGGPYWVATDQLSVTSGSDYVLTDGTDSATITNNALATDIQTDLEGFKSIGTGNVTVSPGTTAGTFTIQAAGKLHTLPELSISSGPATLKSQIIVDPNTKAVGLVIDNFNFGLAMMRPTDPLDFERYFALRASATGISLVGITGVHVKAQNILVEVNESSPSVYGVPLFPVVDFASTPQFASEELTLFDTNHDGKITLGELASLPGAGSFTALAGVSATDPTVVDQDTLASILNSDTNPSSPSGNGQVTVNEAADLLGGTAADLATAKAADVNGTGFINPAGLAVDTGGTPVFLDMNSPLILAQGFLDLNLDGIVALRGSFAFELGPQENVTTVTNGVTGSDTVTTMTIGASNVSAFVGWNGQFDPANPTSDVLVPLGSGSPTGLLMQNLNVGIFLGLSTNLLNSYFAMNFSVNSISVVGLDFLTAKATLSANINVGGGFTAGLGTIDFKDSFPAATPGGQAGLEVNTGDPLHPVLLDSTGFLIDIQIAGDLTITANSSPIVEMQGIFFLETDSTPSFKLFASANLFVGSDINSTGTPLLGINALGVVDVNSAGFAADLDVNLHLGVPSLSLSVAARVIINTTGQDQGVELPPLILSFLNDSTSPLAADLLARLVPDPNDGSTTPNFYKISKYAPDITNPNVDGNGQTIGQNTIADLLNGTSLSSNQYTTQTNYVVAVINGSFNFLGFATGTGTAGIVVSSSGFQAYLNLQFNIGVSGIDLDFKAVGSMSISSAGLYLSVDVGLNADLTSVFHVDANGTLLVDTRGPTEVFELSLSGDLKIANILTVNGSFSIDVGAGGPNTWRLGMDLSGSLGPLTLTAGGWIQSDGQFDLSVGGSIYFGVSGFSISGSVNGEVSLIKSGTNYVYSPTDTYTFTIQVTGSVTLDIIGIDIGASLTLGGSAVFGGSTTKLTLYVSGSVSLGIFGTYTAGPYDIADITIPASIFPAGKAPPDLATLNNGVLSLNVGPTAHLRTNHNPTSTNASYVLTDLGGNVVQVAAFGATETYSGVNSVSADFGGDTDTLTLTSGFSLPLTASSPSGNNTVASAGSGSIMWTGGTGTNTVMSGSGNDTFTVGSGTDYIAGGLGNDTFYNQQGGTAYLFGEKGTFAFNGSTITSMTATSSTAVAGNNTFYATTGNSYIITGAGTNTIYGGGTNYIIGGQGSITFGGGLATLQPTGTPGFDTLSETGGGSYTLTDTRLDGLGTDVMRGIKHAVLTGRSGATFNVSNWTGQAELYGVGGGDVYNVNFKGSGTGQTLIQENGTQGINQANVYGTASADTMTVTSTKVVLGSERATYHGLQQLTVNGNGGNDQINVQSTASSTPTTIADSNGTATINVSSNAPTNTGNLAGIAGALTLQSTGTLHINISDFGDTKNGNNNNVVVTSSAITGFGGANTINYSAAASTSNTLDLEGSNTLGDSFNIQSSNSLFTTTVNGNGGNDTMNVSANAPTVNTSGSTLAGIAGVLNLNLGAATGTQAINIGDFGDTTAGNNANIVITSSAITGFGGANTINYSAGTGTTNTLNLEGSNTLGNIFSIRSTSGLFATTINGNGGSSNDSFNVGSTAPSLSGDIVDGIQGALTIKGNGGTDTMNVSDIGSFGSKNGFLTSTTLTGMGMGPQGITYSGLSAVNVTLGGGSANQFNIQSTLAGVNYFVSGSTGTDTFYVGSMASNAAPDHASILAAIQGPLTIRGASAGTDTVNADDSGNLLAETGLLTSAALTGMGMGTSGITYSGLAFLNIWMGTGGNTMNIQSTAADTATTIDPPTGKPNTFNVGSMAPVLSGGIVDKIQGPLVIVGSGADTMNVDDTGSTSAKTGTLTDKSLTGLNMGPSGITYSGLANLNINLGTGDNTGNSFFINVAAGANLPATTMITAGASGKDTLVANWVTDFNYTLNLFRFSVSTITVGNNFNGTMTDKNPGYIQSIKIGGSLTASGVLVVSNSSDPANPITPTGLQGDINLMTVGGGVAGLVQVSGNLTTLTVGPANTPTSGGVNDVSGKIIVGGQLTTASIAGNVSGLVQETLTVNSLYIGGSVTSTGVIKAVNAADPAQPTTSQGLLGNINTMTVGGGVAGLVQVSGNLTTLTVGPANTPTSGGVNDVSGKIIVGGQLTTASVSGNVSGLISETLTINSFYIGGSLSRSGIISAVNLVNAALGNINSMTIGIDLAGQLIVSGTLKTMVVHGGTPGTVTAGQIGTIAVYAGYGPVVAQIKENGMQRRIEAAVPSASFPTPPPPPAPAPTVSPAGITFQYFYEGLFSPTVEGISSTNLANPQLTARVTNATGNAGPDQFDFSLVTYNDIAKFNLARLDATGNSGISGIRNVAVEGDILPQITKAASNFFAPDSSPAGVYLPNDQLAGVEVRDFVPLASISANSIQAVAFGSSVASNGAIVTGAADTGPAARTVLTPTTLIIKAGSLNVNSGETFRVPFADLTSQQDGFFIDTSTSNGSFDNKDVNFVVQGVSTANSSGTGNNTQPSNVARGAVVALVTAVETFGQTGNLKSSVMENIFLQGDGGSLTAFQPIGNTPTLPKQPFTPSIFSTGPMGDGTIPGPMPSVSAPSIFGSLVSSGAIPATSIIQTTGIRIDPITGALSSVPADFGRVYVTTGNKGPVITTSVVQPSGVLAGDVISRGNLISLVEPSGNFTGVEAAQGNIGTFFTPSGGALMRLGGVTVGNPGSGRTFSGDLLALGNVIGDVTVSGGLVGGRMAALGSFLGNVTIGGTIDSNSALISGGSIGSTVYGTKLNTGNIYGIVAAVGPINFGTIGTTSTAKYFKQNDTLDQAVIDAVFTQGVMPLSTADVFDENTVGDLLNLDQIIINLSKLSVKNGKLSLS
jgi:hypothetical protein